MNSNLQYDNFLIKGSLVSPSIYKIKDFYNKSTYYSHMYLKKGIELWNINPLRTLIAKFDIDKMDFSCMSKEEVEAERILSQQNNIVLNKIKNDESFKKINIDICNLLMAISVERILKGLLLNNGFIIHKSHNLGQFRLLKSAPSFKEYNKLNKEIFSFEEFTKDELTLEAALPWENKKNIQLILLAFTHLRRLRDDVVHLAVSDKQLYLIDLCVYKLVYNLIAKALELDTEIYQKIKTEDQMVEYINKSNILNASGNYHEALDLSNKALAIDSLSKEAWINKGNALSYLGINDEAIKCYDQALVIDSTLKAAWSNKSNILAKIGRHEDALICIDEAIKIDPIDAVSWNNKGYVFIRQNNYKEARIYIDKALELDPSLKEAWGNKGLIMLNLKKFRDALDAYEKKIQFDPSDIEAWIGKGTALAEMNMHKEAIKSFEKAIESNSEYALAWVLKGYSLYALHCYRESITCYDTALEADPKITNIIDLVSLFKAALCDEGYASFNCKDYSNALKCYDRVIELDKNDVGAWESKALVLRKLEKHDASIVSCKRALMIDSKYISARISLAACYLKLNYNSEYDEECKIIRESIDDESDYHKACFESVCGNVSVCLASLRNAIHNKKVDLAWILIDPDLDSIRNDPEFIAFIGEVRNEP